MRGGSPGALLACAALPEDDGLPGGHLSGHLEEASAVLDPFHVGHDGLGVLVLAEVLQVVLGGQVALVAAADDGAEADALGSQEPDQVVHERAALGEAADGARLFGNALHEHLRIGDDACAGIEEAQAVRTDDASPAFAADPPYLPLELLALSAQFAEAGGKDDGALDLVLDALLDQAEDRLGRGEKDGDVELLRNRTDAGEGLEPQDLLALGVDRVYLPATRVP